MLSRKALTNTSFTSVAELETRIDCWVSHWNDNPEPFVWTNPPTRSSTKSPADKPPSTGSPNPRHTRSLQAPGAELVGEVERYEDSYRLCYVRGPEGIIVELAEQIG